MFLPEGDESHFWTFTGNQMSSVLRKFPAYCSHNIRNSQNAANVFHIAQLFINNISVLYIKKECLVFRNFSNTNYISWTMNNSNFVFYRPIYINTRYLCSIMSRLVISVNQFLTTRCATCETGQNCDPNVASFQPIKAFTKLL